MTRRGLRTRAAGAGLLLAVGAGACSTAGPGAAGDGTPAPGADRSSPLTPAPTTGPSTPREADDTSSQGLASAQDTPAPAVPTLGPHREQTDVLDRLPGTAGFACVDVGTARDVRSGSLAAGPFDEARRADVEPGDEIRLYVIPAHSRSMPGVVVTATNTTTGERTRLRQEQVADADLFRFYDLQLPVGPGRWELRASTGTDRGCWTVDLG